MSISYDDARPLLINYVHAQNLAKEFWYGMPFNTTVERNFNVTVEVKRRGKPMTLDYTIQ